MENLEVRDTFGFNAALELPVVEQVKILFEVFGRITPFADEIRSEESPLEFLLGGKAQVGNLSLLIAGGAGLVSGYGTPDYRALLGVGWAPVREEEPQPEPTIELECRSVSVIEDCPDVPELFCEEGVLVTFAPRCDEGNCSYQESRVRCAAGTVCGQEDGEPACVPAPQCVEDGDCVNPPVPICEDDVLTIFVPQCVDQSCQYDAVEEQCPENKVCGLLRGQPGCVEETALVQVEERRIQISDVVFFELNSDLIDSRSFELLSQVATVLVNNPQLRLIRIEGHTDSSGSRDFNLNLSQRRAEAVKNFLVGRGVDEGRLTAVGIGPDQPMFSNETASGRSANRRVEFHIEERD